MVSINGDLPQQQQLQNQRLNNNDDDREYDNRRQQQEQLQPEMQRVPYRLHKQAVAYYFVILPSRDRSAATNSSVFCEPCLIFSTGSACVYRERSCVFANNPISGVILMGSVMSVAPGTFAVCSAAGFLGHLISVRVLLARLRPRQLPLPHDALQSGRAAAPLRAQERPGSHEFGFSRCSIGAVRKRNDRFDLVRYYVPAVSARDPFLVSLNMCIRVCGWELASLLICPLHTSANGTIATDQRAIVENATTLVMNAATSPDWGMVFRGSIVSASQLFVVDNVALGAIIYLSVLIYSPFTCLFGYLGALGGSLVGELTYIIIALGRSPLKKTLPSIGLFLLFTIVFESIKQI
ncbi:unnamed protein product [Trichogramma brassicae]|uniref:Uncharacterized protein n=1 Tax=Trichogramma brassicae TaxID=86971 RepID=A0A6H5J2B7_9HYME|nr:unnamed protein product [Trichogramma brassicae]